MSYTTQVLAEFVHRTNSETMPDGSRRAARQCLLDLLGAAVAAKGSPLAEITAETALKLFASGPATVWFTGGAGVQPAGAAMVNSAMASALDLDDGHRSAGGHPGAGIIPVALAVAQEVEPSGAELLNAVILGYEVAVRVGAARDFKVLDTLSTGGWCAYGAVAAGAWRGRSALLPMTAGLLHAAEIVRLARNVRLETDAQMDKQFPDRTPARVVVHTPAGSYEEFCENPLGDPANPMSPAELEHKFKTLARRHLNADRQRMLISAIERLEQDGASALLQLLNDTA